MAETPTKQSAATSKKQPAATKYIYLGPTIRHADLHAIRMQVRNERLKWPKEYQWLAEFEIKVDELNTKRTDLAERYIWAVKRLKKMA